MQSINPYEPPLAPLANHRAPAVSAGQEPWWSFLRWLPILLCSLISALCVVAGLFQLVLLLALVGGYPPILAHRADQWILGALFPVAFALAALGIGTARYWRQHLSLRALGFLILFLMLAEVGAETFNFLCPITFVPKVARRPHLNQG